jgi:hypothetical protein
MACMGNPGLGRAAWSGAQPLQRQNKFAIRIKTSVSTLQIFSILLSAPGPHRYGVPNPGEGTQ